MTQFSQKKLNDLWRVNLLDVNNMVWSRIYPKGHPPQARHGHTMNSLRNILIIFGGMNQNQEYLNDVVIYNSISNEWYFGLDIGWFHTFKVRCLERDLIMPQQISLIIP